MIRAIVFVCVALGLALITLMFRASSNNAVFEQHYASLFWVGLGLTIGLLVLIGVQVYSLVKKLRGRVFGSKLGLRLMAVFALMAIIPGGLVYAISVQFLNRSIDSWFDVPVDRALDSALDLARGALDADLVEVARQAREAAARIAQSTAQSITEPTAGSTNIVKQIREQFGFDEVAIIAENGDMDAWAGTANQVTRLMPDRPTSMEIKDTITKSPQRVVETLSEGPIYFRVVVLIPSAPSLKGARVLQIMQAAPKKMVSDAQIVGNGKSEYQRLGLLRDGLKKVFALTLTLAMVLTLFSAIALSFLLSDRLSAPLSALAESTRAIAKGDFTKLNPVKSRDEFGVLTQSFNTMTRQLGEASEVVARKQRELETANAYLESILGNLTSGVVTLDERLYVKSINRVASEMLCIDHAMLRGSPLSTWSSVYPVLTNFIAELTEQLGAHNDTTRDKPWEKQIGIDFSEPKMPTHTSSSTNLNSTMQIKLQGKRSLLVRGTKLPASLDGGYVLVLDDITNLIQAQRDAAWGEVARRLAHEIKNPLTPIQLSAERMQMKLADKLPPAEREMLSRATHTIVAQVGALKGMVDDFSLYSRASRMKPGPVDINELVTDVLALYQSMPAKIAVTLAPNIPVILADPALLRQVIHNLMQNAQDALQNIVEPVVRVETRQHENGVTLVVTDNGSGVRDDVKARIFEPYVTTKAKGTGLGLAIVKKIMDEHRGSVTVENVLPQGTAVTLLLPLTYQLAQSSQK